MGWSIDAVDDTAALTTIATVAGRFGGEIDARNRRAATFRSVPDAVRFAAMLATENPEWHVELTEPAASLHGPCRVAVDLTGWRAG
jgi:hypothetical protein